MKMGKLKGFWEKFKAANSLEDDEKYWNKRATSLAYDQAIAKGNVPKDYETLTDIELYEKARSIIGDKSFDDIVGSSNEYSNGYFEELSNRDIKISVLVGIIGAVTAIVVDANGKNIENWMNKLKIDSSTTIGDYDTNNPFDILAGPEHRKLGHDIFSWWKNIPANYKIGDKTVSEITGTHSDSVPFLTLILKWYHDDNLTAFQNVFKTIQHIIVHFSKDFFTPQGIPLPFLGLFTKFCESITTVTGYNVTNILMDNLKKELTTTRASDYASIIVMKTLQRLYFHYTLRNNNLEHESQILIQKQFSFVMYGVTIVSQLGLLLIMKNSYAKSIRATKSVNGGNLNYILVGLFIKNGFQINSMLDKRNKAVLIGYDALIKKYESAQLANPTTKQLRKYQPTQAKQPYYYEICSTEYCDMDDILRAANLTKKAFASNDQLKQLKVIVKLEILKYQLANNSISLEQYMTEKENIIHSYSNGSISSIFNDSTVEAYFYEILNKIMLGEI